MGDSPVDFGGTPAKRVELVRGAFGCDVDPQPVRPRALARGGVHNRENSVRSQHPRGFITGENAGPALANLGLADLVYFCLIHWTPTYELDQEALVAPEMVLDI